jgi:nucleolar protein 14
VTEKDQAFDQYVRELAFEQRAKPKDRTKTEEELATEEKVRLEKAERRRVRRMDGLPDYDSEEENAARRAKRAKTRGGDDLEDDFDNEDEELGALGRGLAEEGAAAEDEEDEEEGSEDDGDEEDDEDPDEEDASDEEGSRDEDADSQFDFGEDADDPEAEAGDQEELVASKPGRRKALVRAPKELPFTFPCPQTHDEFLEIVEDVADSDVAIVVQRIRALHHPSLAEDNQFKLQALAGVLIDHILYVASPPTPHFQVVSGLLPHLHALTHKYPSASAAHFIAKLVLMEKNLKRGLALGATASDAKTFPGLPELALMRTLGALWPTSDLTHAVVSPARLLMGAYLGLGRVRSVHDLASGLFLCTLWLQYEALSKRFVPEAVTFVANTVLHLAPHGFRRPADVPGSFPCPDLGSAACKSLRITSASTVSPSSPPDIVAILAGDAEGEQTKVDLLATAFELIGRFAELYKGLDGFPELFQPLADVLVGVRAAKLPASLQSRLASVSGTLSKLVANHLATRAPLALQAHKPIPIPTYVPKFSSSGGSSYLREKDPDAERAESAKLRRAYKQEKKGALRELRKDARFLAGVQQAAEREKSDAYEARMRRAHASIESERAEEKRDEKEKAKERKRAGKR